MRVQLVQGIPAEQGARGGRVGDGPPAPAVLPRDAGGQIYFAGFDANFFPALDTAWIFRASIETALRADP